MSEELSKKRLGRGLSTLIGEIAPAPVSVMEDKMDVIAQQDNVAFPFQQNYNSLHTDYKVDNTEDFKSDETSHSNLGTGAIFLPIKDILPNPNNPRQFFTEEELEELANSIREHGIIQPIVVRILDNNKAVEIIAGERRWRAAKLAGLTKIPVVVKNVDDKVSLEIAIIENVQRSDLNPIEEAKGYQQLIAEHEYTQSTLAQVIGKSRSYVTNSLRLLKLPEAVLTYIQNGLLSAGHARALVLAANPIELANRVIKDKLSVRQLENLVQQEDEKNIQKEIETGLPIERSQEDEISKFENQIQSLKDLVKEKIGFEMAVKANKSGGGILRLQYKNIDELENLCNKLSQI